MNKKEVNLKELGPNPGHQPERFKEYIELADSQGVFGFEITENG